MAVNPAMTIAVRAGIPYYRIIALSFLTSNRAYHKRVVNGQGAVKTFKVISQ